MPYNLENDKVYCFARFIQLNARAAAFEQAKNMAQSFVETPSTLISDLQLAFDVSMSEALKWKAKSEN